MNNNALFQFIAEFIARLFSGKPKFFVIIQWISFVIGGISAIIMYLKSTSVALPDWVTAIGNVTVVISSIVAMIVAQLPKKDPNTLS
jgi:L-asparagine transporter-like permease